MYYYVLSLLKNALHPWAEAGAGPALTLFCPLVLWLWCFQVWWTQQWVRPNPALERSQSRYWQVPDVKDPLAGRSIRVHRWWLETQAIGQLPQSHPRNASLVLDDCVDAGVAGAKHGGLGVQWHQRTTWVLPWEAWHCRVASSRGVNTSQAVGQAQARFQSVSEPVTFSSWDIWPREDFFSRFVVCCMRLVVWVYLGAVTKKSGHQAYSRLQGLGLTWSTHTKSCVFFGGCGDWWAPGFWRFPPWLKDHTSLLSGQWVLVQKPGASREVEPAAGEGGRGWPCSPNPPSLDLTGTLVHSQGRERRVGGGLQVCTCPATGLSRNLPGIPVREQSFRSLPEWASEKSSGFLGSCLKCWVIQHLKVLWLRML